MIDEDRTAPEELGLGLRPGDAHYRAYVGPPQDYDLVAAMSFNLLTVLGLRQHHALLDVGCGSLRIGRLLIPYLNPGKYVGVEPARWLVEEGVRREVGRDQVEIKKPRFYYGDSPAALPAEEVFDFALAQSIFSHCGLDLIGTWLTGIRARLRPQGALVATFVREDADYGGQGWIYPGCVGYTAETMARQAAAAGYRLCLLDWKHPRQTWALFAAPGFDGSWCEDGAPSWNKSLASGVWTTGG